MAAVDRDDIGELQATIRMLGPDELRVLSYLASRLLVGQKQYGEIDLSRDPRDFRKERSAEIADLLVYTAFEELKTATK